MTQSPASSHDTLPSQEIRDLLVQQRPHLNIIDQKASSSPGTLSGTVVYENNYPLEPD
jgi:hypothetical protein